MKRIKYKGLVDKVLNKAITMTTLIELNKEVPYNVQLVQKATALTIIEPLFDYMETNKSKKIKEITANYRKVIAYMMKEGIIEVIDNVEEHLKNISKDEKNTDNS